MTRVTPLHRYYFAGHLAHVVTEMRRLGPPTLRGYYGLECDVARGGRPSMAERMTTEKITALVAEHASLVSAVADAQWGGCTIREIGAANAAADEASDALLAAIEQLRSEAIDLATAATTARLKTAFDRAAA